jgi:hypothetical protein
MNLLETILNAQNGDVVKQVASNFQLDETQARSAMAALVPALGQGITRNASSAQGLDELIGALARGNHSRYIEEPAAALDQGAVADGNNILGHVFGSKDVSRQVASRAADSTGIDSSILKQMLPMLASVAMGAMSKQGFAGGSAASQAGGGSDLGSLLTGFLDADKDGSILDDVMGMASKFLR